MSYGQKDSTARDLSKHPEPSRFNWLSIFTKEEPDEPQDRVLSTETQIPITTETTVTRPLQRSPSTSYPKFQPTEYSPDSQTEIQGNGKLPTEKSCLNDSHRCIGYQSNGQSRPTNDNVKTVINSKYKFIPFWKRGFHFIPRTRISWRGYIKYLFGF